MKKMIPILGFSIACMISVAACQHTSKATTAHNIQAVGQQQSNPQENISIWKKYSNTQCNITFQYPANWVKSPELNVVNRAGTVAPTEVRFEDTLLHTQFLLTFHPAPSGEMLYQYALQEYKEGRGWFVDNKKEVQVAGKKAISASAYVKKNGKGIVLSIPLKSIIVVFLDKDNTGEFELQFTLPDDGTVSDKAFQRILTSIQFMQ